MTRPPPPPPPGANPPPPPPGQGRPQQPAAHPPPAPAVHQPPAGGPGAPPGGQPPPRDGSAPSRTLLLVGGVVVLLLMVGLIAVLVSSGDDDTNTAGPAATAGAAATGPAATDGGEAAAPLPTEEQAFAACDADDGGEDTPASFEVFDTTAFMTGVIGASTPCRVDELLRDNPDVDVIVLEDVPGSQDDEANLVAARMVRAAGLDTAVFADAPGVASGGTDFFAAGVERLAEPGATFGVHSWATGDGIQGGDLPRDDPEHRRYLDFYDEMGIPQDFYWFTLDAAPADDIYNMTDAELEQYGIVTAFL